MLLSARAGKVSNLCGEVAMPMFKDIRGDRYGRLVVIDDRHDKRNGTWRVRCQCDCGAERIVQWSHLRDGKTKSCGCFKRDGNGHRVSAE
jgi:hypothetical protein